MIEFLMAFMGDQARWQTMPRMVTFFGILVVPLGVVSVTLIILQPVAVGGVVYAVPDRRGRDPGHDLAHPRRSRGDVAVPRPGPP